jgi:hypothetical protein
MLQWTQSFAIVLIYFATMLSHFTIMLSHFIILWVILKIPSDILLQGSVILEILSVMLIHFVKFLSHSQDSVSHSLEWLLWACGMEGGSRLDR